MRLIKKYPNRRLYDTQTSAYIKLSGVHELLRRGVELQVVDADSGEDITRSILIQIILEQEQGETPIFTTDMLTRFIRFYDEASHGVFGEFLDQNLQFFQQQMEGVMMAPPVKMMAEMTERNLALWQDMQQRFFEIATGGPATARKPRKREEG